MTAVFDVASPAAFVNFCINVMPTIVCARLSGRENKTVKFCIDVCPKLKVYRIVWVMPQKRSNNLSSDKP